MGLNKVKHQNIGKCIYFYARIDTFEIDIFLNINIVVWKINERIIKERKNNNNKMIYFQNIKLSDFVIEKSANWWQCFYS